ncbi:hypothetical protein N752_24090 [Desulforamulus aquiferis]|nr:hypothetical protein N752_24090 [Desulforamulus aquiferis]
MKKLEQKGYIRRDPTKPRAIEIITDQDKSVDSTSTSKGKFNDDEELITVPLLGQIAAGVPLLAVENYDETLTLPRSFTGLVIFSC